MDDSLSHWLRLREPFDAAARSAALTRAIAAAMPAGEPLRLLDLATGAGSNIRYLAGRLPGPQRWLAVDASAPLLADLRERMASWGAARGCDVQVGRDECIVRGQQLDCRIETRQMDLGMLDDHGIFAGRHLVTASALLDLVSGSWLRSVAAHCRAEGAAALFTITYNGRSSCDPVEPEDDMVRDLLNRHQERDKGLGGPAAGKDAATLAERCFAESGYHVVREASDWRLGPAEAAVQGLLVNGWAQPAMDMAPDRAAVIADWLARRLAHLDAGRSHVIVGHTDVAAWPPRA